MTRLEHVAAAASLLLAGGTAQRAIAQGAPVGPEFQVNFFTTFNQNRPRVVSSPLGGFLVVWEGAGSDPSNTGVYGRRYSSSGAPLGGDFQVNSFTTSFQDFPDAAFDSSGNFVAVWRSAGNQDGDSYGIFGQRFGSSGAPAGAEFRVNTYTTSGQSSGRVAMDPAGNFVVVWDSVQDGSGQGVFGQRYDSSGALRGGEFRVNTTILNSQNFPAIAADSAGNFVVVWASYGQDGNLYGIFGQRFGSAGAPAGPEFRVNSYSTGDQANARVAMDPAGNFVVVWNSFVQDSGGLGVFGQRYDSTGAPRGGEFQINAYTTNVQRNPDIASDSTGNFVVVWHSKGQDGFFDVIGRRYSSNGASLGSDFLVNTFTTDNQTNASVASDAAGDFVVVWESYTQDGSLFGIFGQRYGKILPVELIRFTAE